MHGHAASGQHADMHAAGAAEDPRTSVADAADAAQGETIA
jgi:hypothetical protein